ncbi:unnamed protein product [Calicophoron daubneyi]|uniref:Uncharacterized protein n=1 Tax=Calicophoron daubneyi TaxID=300641 RepID=A0AAV2TLN5_CALDB
MFYSVELLSAHHGKFGLIWLAATHMRKTLTRRELNSVDIVDACNEVMSSILGRVKIRMSLYLASQLTFGLCIIYREKTKSVLRDLQELYTRSGFTFHPQSIDLPVSGSARRTKKRAREEASADMPEVAVRDQLVDLIGFGDLEMPELVATPYVNPDIELLETQNSLYQARAEDITLIEENLTTTTGTEMTFGEDLQPVSLDLLQNVEVFQSESKREISGPIPHPPISVDLVDLDRLEEEMVSKMPREPSPKQANSQELIKDEKLWAGQEQVIVTQEAQLIQEALTASLDNRSVLPTEDGLPIPAEDQNQPGVSTETVVEEAERMEQRTFQIPGDERPASSAEKELAQEVGKVVQSESTMVLAPEKGTDQTKDSRIAQHPEQDSALDGHQSQHPLRDTNPYVMPTLEVEPLKPMRPTTARRGRHASGSKLIIDSKTRLSIDELRYNMEHGEETMVLHDTLLAEPSSRTKTRYLLSRCVPRLLALPASIETALSARLCDVWCRHRRWCEDMLTASLTVDHLVPSDGGGDRPTGSTSVHLSRLNEEGETSIEQMRAAQTTPSLPQSSLLGTTGTMDLTVNQSTKHTSLLENTVSPRLRAVDHSTVAPPIEPASVPPPPTSMAAAVPELTFTDTTHLQREPPAPEPVPEEQKSNQTEPKFDTAPQPVLLELPAESVPPAVQFTYTSRDDVWKQIQTTLSAGATEIEIRELCPLGMSKKDASLVFSSLLELAKKKRVVLSQSEPFGPITITLPRSVIYIDDVLC